MYNTRERAGAQFASLQKPLTLFIILDIVTDSADIFTVFKLDSFAACIAIDRSCLKKCLPLKNLILKRIY